MAPHWWLLRAIIAFEDRIVESILRQPGFHRAVGRVHRAVNERKYGRDPNEPLSQGEATADPSSPNRTQGFLRYFFEELRNQVRGKPTDMPSQPPPSQPPAKK